CHRSTTRLTRSTMSRDFGDQEAQTTTTVAPRPTSPSASCSSPIPRKRQGWAIAALEASSAKRTARAQERRIRDRKSTMFCCLLEGASLLSAVGHAGEDAQAQPIGSTTAGATFSDDEDDLLRVIRVRRALRAPLEVVFERCQQILFHLVVDEKVDHLADPLTVYRRHPPRLRRFAQARLRSVQRELAGRPGNSFLRAGRRGIRVISCRPAPAGSASWPARARAGSRGRGRTRASPLRAAGGRDTAGS